MRDDALEPAKLDDPGLKVRCCSARRSALVPQECLAKRTTHSVCACVIVIRQVTWLTFFIEQHAQCGRGTGTSK